MYEVVLFFKLDAFFSITIKGPTLNKIAKIKTDLHILCSAPVNKEDFLL